MNKLLALFNVFRKGECCVHPAAWKNGQITGSILAGLLAAIVAASKAFGFDLFISDEQLLAIGSGIVAIVGLFINPAITTATSSKVGLPAVNEVIVEKSHLTNE
jgi:hypothetical protein